MKAIVYTESLPIDHPRSLFVRELPKPTPGPRDLLVRIHAIAVNPVDTKVRMRRQGTEQAPVVLGWDAAGLVEAVGSEVSLFKVGDAVMYAGDLNRAGAYAEYGVVDERIVGRKPERLSFAEAAALPLTAITAWECLFERLQVPFGKAPTNDALLIVGAAGGVGSIAVQLARTLTNLTVIGTASRPDSAAWVQRAGAHHVVSPHSLIEEMKRIGHAEVRYLLSLTATDQHWDALTTIAAPQGRLCLIDDPVALDVPRLKAKSVSLHYELMFTRSMFGTPDMIQQHKLLNEVASLVDAGLVHTTLGRNLGAMTVEALREAHALIESGKAIGKLVMEVV